LIIILYSLYLKKKLKNNLVNAKVPSKAMIFCLF
jgi:hypothetical protein